jgi:ABC-type multidrug transport system fused ATPase/permease subunit
MSTEQTKTGGFRGIRRAWSLVDPHSRRRLKLVALYGILIAALDTVALVLIYALINVLNGQAVTGIAGRLVGAQTRGSDHYHEALVLLLITALLFVTRSILSVLGLWLTVGASNTADANLIARLLRGHAHAPQAMRLERNSAETLRTVLGSADQVVVGVVASSVSLISNCAVAVAVALGLFLSSPSVAAVVTVYFVVIGVAWVRLVRGALRTRGFQVQELQRERYQFVLQGFASAKELQLRGRAVFYADAAINRTRGINTVMRGASVLNQSLRYMLETSLVIGAVIVVAAAGLTGGHASVLPAVGLVLAGAFRFLPALNQILFLSNSVQFNQRATDFVEKELETFGMYADAAGPEEPQVGPLRLRHVVALEHVGFTYPTRSVRALDDVSITVRRGESLGVIGPTGSGKSTLLDILLGVTESQSGSVTVDGVPMSTCRDPWQRSIGYVPQDVYVVDDTVRANVALGWYGDDIDDERVDEALRLAGLEEVVAVLPDGVESIVGERGVRLSGGQRQRIGLARALYTRPTVLVLDEATSNLDQTTERTIVDTLAGLRGGITMVIVTHRLASVRYCDRLVYLEAGKVRAVGSLDEIRARVPGLDEPPSQLVASA